MVILARAATRAAAAVVMAAAAEAAEAPRAMLRAAPMRFVGHRGASHVVPENTLGAFREALAQGCGFECDLQLLASGEVVVLHDDTLERTGTLGDDASGTSTAAAAESLLHRPASALRWEEVRSVDVGSRLGGPAWAAERVPRFDEALALLAEAGRAEPPSVALAHPPVCFAELKEAADSTSGSRLAMAAAAAAVVRSSGVPPAAVTWISFSLDLLREVKAILPEYPALYVAKVDEKESAWEVARACVEANLDGIDLQADPAFVTADLVEWLAARGKMVAVWVYRAPAENDTPEMWSAMEAVGVHSFTSNVPPELAAWRRERTTCTAAAT